MDEEQHAFVTYTSLKEAQRAARGMNGAILHGERITAKVEGSSSPESSDHTVKVEILAGHASEESLEEVFGFQEDAEVLSVTVKTPAIGSTYAYIYYSNEEDAQRAVSELNGTMIDRSTLKVKSHTLTEKLEVNCEPVVVRIITSPDRPEYRSQIQSIEHANLVSIKSMKNEQGFDLKGNMETLEEVKTHLELVISKLWDRLEDEQFTLPSSCISLFANHEITKQISKIEHKHCVQFYICGAQESESVKISEFLQHMTSSVKTEAASLEDASAMAERVPASKEEIQTHELNLKACGLNENLAQAIVALKTLFH